MNWIYEKMTTTHPYLCLELRGKNPLICFGVNPSTEEPTKLDNTLKSVERIAASNGNDSWIMMNLTTLLASESPQSKHIWSAFFLSV